MSEIMLEAVLRMPPDLWDGGAIDVMQRHGRYIQAADEIEKLTAERDCAVQMLADWCDAVRDNGTGWDDWDEHYKDADFRPCLIRDLIDAARQPEKE